MMVNVLIVAQKICGKKKVLENAETVIVIVLLAIVTVIIIACLVYLKDI